jgi:hypothetical protein
MADSAALRERMAAAIIDADTVSLHTADPDGTGANEVTGGGYARVPITAWTAGPVDGTYTATLGGNFNVPANTEIEWAGLWDGSTYLDKAPASASTIGADIVEILSLTFVVYEPDDPEGPGA